MDNITTLLEYLIVHKSRGDSGQNKPCTVFPVHHKRSQTITTWSFPMVLYRVIRFSKNLAGLTASQTLNNDIFCDRIIYSLCSFLFCSFLNFFLVNQVILILLSARSLVHSDAACVKQQVTILAINHFFRLLTCWFMGPEGTLGIKCRPAGHTHEHLYRMVEEQSQQFVVYYHDVWCGCNPHLNQYQ